MSKSMKNDDVIKRFRELVYAHNSDLKKNVMRMIDVVVQKKVEKFLIEEVERARKEKV